MRNHLEKVRSSKQISIARLNTRKRSENIDLKAAQRIVNDVMVNRPENDQNFNEVATEKQKSHNQLLGGSQSKTNKGQHENSDASKDINVMESNKDVQLQNISEPVVRMQTGTSIVEGESFKSKQAILDDIKNSPHKKESVPIPLDSDSPDKKNRQTVNVEEKKIRNLDLGIIVEEEHSTTNSKIMGYALQRGVTMMQQSTNNPDKNLLRQNSIFKGKSSTRDKIMYPIPNENDEESKDFYKNLYKMKPSNTALNEISDELSKITDSGLMNCNSQKSSTKSVLKNTIDNINKKTRQLYPITGFNKNKDKSENRSISSIIGDSINYVNPEERKGNEGMIVDQLNSVRKSDTINTSEVRLNKIDQSSRNVSKINNQLSRRILNDSDLLEDNSISENENKEATDEVKPLNPNKSSSGLKLSKTPTNPLAIKLHVLSKKNNN